MAHSIQVPGYRDLEVLHFSARSALIIQRGRRADRPEETVIIKANTFYDEEENVKLKHEYELLHHIHANLKEVEAASKNSNAAPKLSSGFSRGEPLTPVNEEPTLPISSTAIPEKRRLSGKRARSSSLNHDSIEGNLADRIVRPLALEDINEQFFLVLEDYGGMSLREFAGGKPWERENEQVDRLSGPTVIGTSTFENDEVTGMHRTLKRVRQREVCLEDFLHIATQLAEALEIVHGAQVMHKDINPDNIVVKKYNNRIGVQLIDFNLAEVTDMGSRAVQRNFLEGTLAYLSPEQTGRMQRVVDYRTDFYSLGITLWELLVGSPPFQFDDATEYVHAHLAKEIEPAKVHDRLIPQAFSDIIDKLVSKSPEARYQSASGLRYDFMKCMKRLKEIKATKRCSSTDRLSDADVGEGFEKFQLDIASRDHSPHISIPDKLYGREREMEELITAYENIASGKSRSELVLISGSIGEGKSSLITHLRRHVMGKKGFFVSGHYTELNRERLYGGLVQALEMLIRQLLGESVETLERWQNLLRTALGPAALTLVTEILPELDMIVGDEPNSEIRTDQTSAEQNAFVRAMQGLIGVFAQSEHPLVIFLDDIQHAEAASQKLLQAILFDKKIAHLLIIATHPNTGDAAGTTYGPTIQRMQFEAPQRLRRIELKPLSSAALKEMLSDTLKPAVEDVEPLAALLFRKTMGNPLHIREFLRYAEQQGLIYFNELVGGWAWDIQEMDRQSVLSENVAELLLTRLRQFSSDTQMLLQQAACIGDTFDLQILSVVSDLSIVQVATHLWAAIKEGFLLPQSQEYTPTRALSTISRSSSGSINSQHPARQSHRSSLSLTNRSVGGMVMTYKFCHARVKHACYDMMEPERRKDTHLQIARILRRNMIEEDQQDGVFTIVNQYDEALNMLTDPEERMYVARINYEAGLRSKKAGMHSAARRLFDITVSLTGDTDQSWEQQYELLFNTKKAMAVNCLMETAYDESVAILKDLSGRARSPLDKLLVSTIKAGIYHIQGKFNEIMEMGFRELKAFDIRLPENDEQAAEMVKAELWELENLIDGRSPADLASATSTNDSTTHRLQSIYLSIAGAASSLGKFYESQFFYLKGCVLALQKGITSYSAELFAFVLRAYTQPANGPNFERMRWIVELVFLLMDRSSISTQVRARLGLMLNGYVYVSTFKEYEENAEQCITLGMDSMQYSIVVYALCTFPGVLLAYGRPVFAWKDWEKKYSPFMNKFKGYFLNVWNGTLAELEALNTGIECVYQNRDVMAAGMSRIQVYYFRLVNAMLYDRADKRFLLEQYRKEDTLNVFMGLPRFIDVFVWQAVIAASEYSSSSSPQNKDQLIADIEESYNLVKKFAEQEPSEISCKFLLIAAERERVRGNVDAARKFYEGALDAAQEHGFRLHEALITQLYGRFWLEAGSKRLARSCLHDAYFLWNVWGSEGICRHLQSAYAGVVDLMNLTAKGVTGTRYGNSHGGATQRSSITEHSSSAVDLDLTTMLKVTQSITNETSLEVLLTKIIKFVMENAGAEKGLLMLQEDGKLLIEALGVVDDSGEHHTVLQHIPIEKATLEQGAPLSVVYYVYRRREPLVLADASMDETYGKDLYISERKTKSTLCCPIIHQNTVSGVVYLENDLSGVFTADRLELIQSLMVAASMSIENAKLSKTNTELTAALRDSNVKSKPRYDLDGPIKKTIDMLQGLKFRLPPGDPGIKQVDFIMKALTSTDLFSSNIDEINDETGKGLDSDTKNWIESSLLQREPRRPSRSRPDEKEQMSARRGEVRFSPKVDGPLGIGRPAKEMPLINMMEVNALLERSTTSDFNIFDLAEATNGRPLYFLAVHLLEYYGLLEHFSLDETKVRTFFDKIEGSYHPLPYHNSTHGADVLQTVNMLLLSDVNMASKFTKLEIFSACIASAVHDVDHPGLNNNFLVQSSNPLAIFYNDMSVLEYHHSAKAFEIALKAETNVFAGMSNEQYREARKLIISMVVATDMAQHFQYVNKLKGKMAASALNWEDSSDRGLILECAIKCADLNNSAKPLEQSRKWAFQVMQEFFLQGDRERKLGMPVSKFMDRHDTNIPKCQIGFIDVLVVPLFDAWCQCIQTDYSRRCMENITQNRGHWESIRETPDAIPKFPSPPDEEREEYQLLTPSTPPFTPQATPPIIDTYFRPDSKDKRSGNTPPEDIKNSDSSFRAVPPLTKRPVELIRRTSGPLLGATRNTQNQSRTPSEPSTPPTLGKVMVKSPSGNNIVGRAEGIGRTESVSSAMRSPAYGEKNTSIEARSIASGRRRSSSAGGPGGEINITKIPGKVVLPALPKSTSITMEREDGERTEGLLRSREASESKTSVPSRGKTLAS